MRSQGVPGIDDGEQPGGDQYIFQTTNLRLVYSGGFQLVEDIAYWLWIVGVFIFGVAFLQSGLPTGIGYLSAGGALVYALSVLVPGAGFITPSLIALLRLIIGIALLRQ